MGCFYTLRGSGYLRAHSGKQSLMVIKTHRHKATENAKKRHRQVPTDVIFCPASQRVRCCLRQEAVHKQPGLHPRARNPNVRVGNQGWGRGDRGQPLEEARKVSLLGHPPSHHPFYHQCSHPASASAPSRRWLPPASPFTQMLSSG